MKNSKKGGKSRGGGDINLEVLEKIADMKGVTGAGGV